VNTAPSWCYELVLTTYLECITNIHLIAYPHALLLCMHFCTLQTALWPLGPCGHIGHFRWNGTAVLWFLPLGAAGFRSLVLIDTLLR
jgi:hypothetical protein